MPRDEDVGDDFLSALLDDDPQTLYDRAPCGYLSTTPDGTILKANATFAELSGYAREVLTGHMRFVDLLTPGSRLYHETHYAPLLSMAGSVREIAMELLRADGHRVPVLVNSVLERDAHGHPNVVRTAVFDASQRRRYEKELLAERQRAEASEERARALARALQDVLMPPLLPGLPGLDFAVGYRAGGDGTDVAADFYDIFQAGKDDWVVVLGDVSGKGAAAARVTALARYTLRAAAMQDPSPAHALAELNAALGDEDLERLCTAIVLRLTRNEGSWHLTVADAGHPPPLRITQRGAVGLLGTPGSLLGVLARPHLTEVSHTIETGETIVLYTDGVTLARAPDRTFYGEDRLLARLARAPRESAADVVTAIVSDVVGFQRGECRDDLAVVAIRAV